MIFLVCKQCKTKLTAILEPCGNEKSWDDYSDYCDKDFIDAGFYINDLEGNYILNMIDKRNLNYHSDKSRLNGCCGPSEGELSNLVCRCNTEIGREISDCITPHYTRINREQVNVIKDKWGVFSLIKNMEREKTDNEHLNHFYELLQYGDEESAIEYLQNNLKSNLLNKNTEGITDINRYFRII
jgi:hypothetical protein